MSEKRKSKCKTCECYECDVEECNCDCHDKESTEEQLELDFVN